LFVAQNQVVVPSPDWPFSRNDHELPVAESQFGMTRPFPTLNYWCAVAKDLDSVAEMLASSFRLHEVEFDAEDLYEWFTASDEDGGHWNVSRKHVGGESDYGDPLRIVIMPVPEHEEQIGGRLASALCCPVSFGRVTYLKGDEWEYEQQNVFTPSAEPG